MTDAPRVLALVGDDTGPSLWRVWLPFAELQRRGIFAHWKAIDDPEFHTKAFKRNMLTRFDALILARVAWHHRLDGVEQLRGFQQSGLAVILETDDDMYSPGIVERQYAVYDRERAKGRAELERERETRLWLIRHVDGITVSTRRLRTALRQHTDVPIEVVPNAVDVAWFRRTLRSGMRIVPPLTVGWAGGARSAQDLEPVAAAWARLAVRFPELTFVVQGHMADELIAAVPGDRLRRLPWLPLEDYPRALLNIDIACCSVAPNLFNTSKTPIKVWECTLAGAACVVSPTLYGPYVTDGEDGLIAETADEWEAALARLVEDAELRRSLQRRQRQRIVSEHALGTTWWRWPQAWTNILARRALPTPTPARARSATSV